MLRFWFLFAGMRMRKFKFQFRIDIQRFDFSVFFHKLIMMSLEPSQKIFTVRESREQHKENRHHENGNWSGSDHAAQNSNAYRISGNAPEIFRSERGVNRNISGYEIWVKNYAILMKSWEFVYRGRFGRLTGWLPISATHIKTDEVCLSVWTGPTPANLWISRYKFMLSAYIRGHAFIGDCE